MKNEIKDELNAELTADQIAISKRGDEIMSVQFLASRPHHFRREKILSDGTEMWIETPPSHCDRVRANLVQPRLKTAAALRAQDLDLYMNQEPTP